MRTEDKYRVAFTFTVLTAAALLLSACSERPVTVYKQGSYQGKADTQPWAGEQFKGDKTAWETAVKNRNQAQNEYSRVMGSAKQGG